MVSSRGSSPARSESGATSPLQLTPNSKVKAMLATFDNDSDDESVSGPAAFRIAHSLAKESTSKTNSYNSKISEESEARATRIPMESNSEDEDEDIVRPKGRMAAMMQAEGNNAEVDAQPWPQSARERVRRMLMTRNSSPVPTTNIEDTDESEEGDTPVVSRKRKDRVARRDTPKSSPPRRSASPGLFVSPAKSVTADTDVHESNSEVELPNVGNSRFLALVKQKRLERLAREAEVAKEKARKLEERNRYAATLEQNDSDDLEDSDAERRLTQPSRPARKASKKAIEEMHRETQRLSRNQQLAHNAITKKKITKASLFAKFNYRSAKEEEATPKPIHLVNSSSPARHSDFEAKDTPPTSPASETGDGKKSALPDNLSTLVDDMEHNNDEDQPTLEDSMIKMPSSPPIRLDKGKAIQGDTTEPEVSKRPLFTKRPIRARPPKVTDRKSSPMDDSDSDLEIVSARTPGRKQKLDSIFDRVPAKLAKESHSLHTLRMLAHITSPAKQNSGRNSRNQKPSMTTSEMQMSLQQRARQQATREREERLQALRDKGIIIQTAEEREKEMAEVDDMVARARREGEEIAKREKAAAKKERKEKGETDPLADDSSEDEDYKEAEELPEENVSLSGSEEEDESDDETADRSGEEEDDEIELDGDDADLDVGNPMFDNEAVENEDDEREDEVDLTIHEESAEDGDAEDEDEELSVNFKPRRSRNANVISDDEEEVEQEEKQTPDMPQTDSPHPLSSKSPMAPNSVLRSATKTFIPGLTVAGPAGLGLTQIFAGTMDDSQSVEASPTALNIESRQAESNQDSMSFLRRLRAPELPPFVPTLEEDTQDADMFNRSQLSHIPESQPIESENQNGESQIQLHFSQSQIHEFDSLVYDTQMSPFPEATQDVGYQHMTPIKGRFVDEPPSTVDTVVLERTAIPETMDETPIVKKRGKLRQRVQLPTFSDEEDAGEATEKDVEEDEFEITANAFDVMRKSAKKAEKKKMVVDEFDKKNSKAKEMVNEQAEESEDEYAGLGGASDDESGGEEDAYVKEMIDDEGGKDVDESKLAAFFADRERASDEKQVEKLYKDITNGMLRRKRGADYDLSDSDDGGEAKQRRKRKEFAKMRKALLADERIGKIAENPKRQAFLRAIEDRGSEDEMDFLVDFVEQEEETDSQSQSQGEGPQIIPDSQPTFMGPPKRKRIDDRPDGQIRAPPHLRRTKPAKRPSNLSDIRESLSSLIEEPNMMARPEESGSDSENELSFDGDDDLDSPRKARNKENRDPFALRRTNIPVVDRISLKRASSSSISTSTKLAFTVSSATPGFKVPPLLRRATTNNSLASTSSNSSVSGGMSATERMAGGGGADGVKRGGGRNSGVNFYARESERKANVVKTEKRREEKMVKGAKTRRKVVGGLFGGGKFE